MIVPYAVNFEIHDSELQSGDILIDPKGGIDPIDPEHDYKSLLVLGYDKTSKMLYVMYDNNLIKTYRDAADLWDLWDNWFVIR